jgi:hypothetical protein
MSIDSSLSKQWECSCDIELALIKPIDENLLIFINSYVVEGYSVENKNDLGWGYVISKDEEWVGDRRKISDLICRFLSDIEAIILRVRDVRPKIDPILRIGLYYGSYTFTINLLKESINKMERAGVELELSLYPSLEDN